MIDAEPTQTIAIDHIRDPKVCLRPVRTNTLAYREFFDSVRDTGLWNSIAVRPITPPYYEVIDGFYRLTICRQLGRKFMPCIIREATDKEVLAAQIRANAVRPDTRPVEFARQLRRIQEEEPDTTLPELAVMVSKTAQWVRSQLGLLKLVPEAAERVDRGDIALQSAYILSKVPENKQLGLVEDAVRLPVKEFTALAASVIRQWMEAAKTGRLSAFYDRKAQTTQPYLRPLKETLEELGRRRLAVKVLEQEQALTLTDAFYAGLRWVAHLDKDSIAAQHRRAEERATDYLKRADTLKALKKGASK